MKSIILCDSNVLINETCQCKVIACIVYTQIWNWILFHIHRRLKGGAGGATAPPIFRKRGSAPPKFLLLATYPTKVMSMILLK